MSKFNQYRVFVTVVETGSVSTAAQYLNYTPPAVSKQLAALEASLQQPLFYRSHKKLSVTAAGKVFYKRCQSILAAVKAAEDEIALAAMTIKGKLAITLSKSLCHSFLFDILSDFTRQHDQIRYDIRLSDGFDDLHEGDLDFAFRLGKLQNTHDIVATPLLDTQLVACATPDYIKKHGNPDHLSRISTGKLILPHTQYQSHPFKQFLKQHRHAYNDDQLHYSDDIEAIYHCVRAGLCIGFMLNISVQNDLDNGLFVPVLRQHSLPKKKLYLLYKKNHWKSYIHDAFRDFVRQQIDGFRHG